MDAELPLLAGRGEARFWLGTDNQGRDIWSTILYGAPHLADHWSVRGGLQLVLGIVIGLMAGYFGGRIDNLLMRFADVQLSFSTMMVGDHHLRHLPGDLWPRVLLSKFAILMLVVIIGIAEWPSMPGRCAPPCWRRRRRSMWKRLR